MKILAVSHEFPPIGGGGANACKYLTRGFQNAGHEVTLLTAGFGDLAAEEMLDGIRILRVPSKRAHKDHCSFFEMLDYLRLARPMARRLQKETGFDLCLIFFGIPSGPIGRMLKRKYDIPYVIRFGGGDIPGFQKRFTKIYKLIGPSIRGIWKGADARIANSGGLKDMALEFCDRYPFEVIPNGVDLVEYTPAEKKEKPDGDAVILLFVSRLIERKGLQHILPLLREIAEHTGRKILLQIVGDGPYRENLEEQVRQLAIEDLVEFLGRKEKGEILPFYQNADLFLLPSAKEGMPNVVLEAMACGLPIVMTPCQGSAELISDNGFVVPITEFGEALEKVIADETLRAKMGQSSRRIAEEEFSWDRTTQRYLELFEVVGKK